MYTDTQLSGIETAVKDAVMVASDTHGIKADSISVSIVIGERKAGPSNPQGMPLALFRSTFSKSKKGKPLAYNTLNRWRRVGKIKVLDITSKYKLVTEFNSKGWDGEGFTVAK